MVQRLELYIAQNCNCNSSACETLCLVKDKMTAIDINFEDDLGLDISGTQTLLNEIIEMITTEFNVLRINF